MIFSESHDLNKHANFRLSLILSGLIYGNSSIRNELSVYHNSGRKTALEFHTVVMNDLWKCPRLTEFPKQYDQHARDRFCFKHFICAILFNLHLPPLITGACGLASLSLYFQTGETGAKQDCGASVLSIVKTLFHNRNTIKVCSLLLNVFFFFLQWVPFQPKENVKKVMLK